MRHICVFLLLLVGPFGLASPTASPTLLSPKQGISDNGRGKRLPSYALDFERLGNEALQFETDHAADSRSAGE